MIHLPRISRLDTEHISFKTTSVPYIMIGAGCLVEWFRLLMLVRSLLAWSRLSSNHEIGRQRSRVSMWRAIIRQVQ